MGLSRRTEDRFACGILRTWEQLRPALIQLTPSCIEERLRQPVVWNPKIRTNRGFMVGSRPHVSWGAFARGPGCSVGDWLQFRELPAEQQRDRCSGMRGALQMISDVESAASAEWGQQTILPPPATWMGAFTQTEILIGARGCTQEMTLIYEVGEAGRLIRVTEESEIISTCTFQRIRVLGTRARTWHIDPDPAEIQSNRDWCLWVWEARPLI